MDFLNLFLLGNQTGNQTGAQQVSVGGGETPEFLEQVKGLIEMVAGWSLVVAPGLAVILLGIAGIKYMNANSQMKREEVTSRFKNIFIGLLIVFFAVQIINFMVSRFG